MTRADQIALTAFRRSPLAIPLRVLVDKLEARVRDRYEAEPASEFNRGALQGVRELRDFLFDTPT